ncbi:hypothetical protein SUGI_1095550 [Cryptomeria japonica]|nr:hypothetical protein SUGI_1095550 [Cryptomeria japonica]
MTPIATEQKTAAEVSRETTAGKPKRAVKVMPAGSEPLAWAYKLEEPFIRLPSERPLTVGLRTFYLHGFRENERKDFAAAIRRSPSVDSLTSIVGVKTCVCAPTTHAGSFRCRLHRNPSSVSHAAAAPLPPSVTAAPRSSASNTSIEAR